MFLKTVSFFQRFGNRRVQSEAIFNLINSHSEDKIKGHGFDPVLNKGLMPSISTIPSIIAGAF